MVRIRALNEPDLSTSTSDESANEDGGGQPALSKEAAEEQCFEKYRAALLAIQDTRTAEARKLLEELEDELSDMEMSSDAQISISLLKFSVMKNLGNLCQDKVDHFVEALSIDPSDISLWIKAGDRGARLGLYPFARQCYEQALDINPNNRVAIDRLMELYYVLHLPFELYDMCMRALALNPKHSKAQILIEQAKRFQPSLEEQTPDHFLNDSDALIEPLEKIRRKRRAQIQDELQKFKKTRFSITLDTARTQSLSSFGNYVMRVYERFAKQGITRNSVIDITLNNTISLSQQASQNQGSLNSQSNNQNSSEMQTSCSQDMEIDGEGTSLSDKSNDKSSNNETKSNSNKSRPNPKNSSLSFAALLFPMDSGDKRRSSRNRSNQDDLFSFKMKFDELNELLPEILRIGAIEQTLQQRREEQQQNSETRTSESQEESVSIENNLEPMREDLIIKDIIEAITKDVRATGSTISDVKLCDMFFLYLSKVSSKKQNTLPEIFLKIYKTYRKLCSLPTGVFVEIGQDGISIDELWFTLAANEIAYQPGECPFLLRCLDQLQFYIDETQHKEFMVRLFLVMGMNADHRYLKAALDRLEEDTRVYAANRKIITRAHIKTIIDKTDAQQQQSEEPDDSMDIINKLGPKSENEISDREITQLCAAIRSAEAWQRGLDILNQRNNIDSDIILETVNECLKHGATMDAILASKLCKDAISGQRVVSWTCIYRGWLSRLSPSELAEESNVESIDKFFELGHQTLGKKNICTSDNGEFLMLYVQHLLNDDRECFEERELLGALNCLFGYPNKRPSQVAGHKAQRVPIKWEYAETIYNYLVPEELPTYMSLLRKVGITGELEPVFKEIALAAPDDLNPSKHVKIIENFIDHGEPMSNLGDVVKNDVTKDIYYYLADYYFKNKDFAKAKEFYNYDLVLNTDRFDSWAASALIRANGIDKALSDGVISAEDFVKGPFHDLADSAIRCFEQATKLKPNEAKATLWIEFGNLTYNLISLASRLFTYEDFEAEMEDRDIGDTGDLEARHRYLYKLAKNCFTSANRLCVSEEIWLHYYMLGKIHEKVSVFKALEYYMMADGQLFMEQASYPSKISYHNPPDLAYEAMEVHYRIHSCAMKYLITATARDLSQELMDKLKKYLLAAQRSPFVEYEGITDPHLKMGDRAHRDVALFLSDVIDMASDNANYDELLFMCLHGMKRCLVRCDKNFKALYRLAFYYQRIHAPKMAQEILLAKELPTDSRINDLLMLRPGVPEFLAAPPDLRGIDSLFRDRKIGNLFFNIWRIPVEEVDRPGSFEHWMFKSTWLLIKTCDNMLDTNVLSMIATQLSRQPETSKKYLQDKPRMLLGLCACKSIGRIVDDAISKAGTRELKSAFISKGMTIADRLIKQNVFVDRMRELFERWQREAQSLPRIY